ncbi:Gfo/Idh/MocA family protein [Tetragenococcus halophilus]|uniref:Gfo/Idh/MocA family protein n=1 Tax=Tetragenococcus halophilus TaxID=51669 RepID=UPI00209A7F39|nr:Gfo/Idh/MocA family oxidoreductase [Tetragenococcus halophilus]MCO8287249.1 Gfo/Idh/MocA family oxidoreductase [Tetragenococcus halophilus]
MTDIKKEEQTLKIGVLGAGQISQAAHFDSIRRSSNAELYAICDVDEFLLNRMSEIYHPTKVYRDYDEMLADTELDAVVIGISDNFHVPMTIKAVKAGKPVLVEKPLGMSIEEVEELGRIVKESNVYVQVGNMKRFDPGIEAAKDFIYEEMGEMLTLKAWYCDNTYRYTTTDNVQPVILEGVNAKKPEGDPKADKRRYYMRGHGSHLFDTARYLGGNIVAVTAWLTEKYGSYSWLITTEFANGSVGQLDLTLQVRMDWHEGFEVYGEYGSVLAKTYNPWFFKGSDVEIFKTSDGNYHRPIAADGHFYRRQIEDFSHTVLTGKKGRGATVFDGIETMKIMQAVQNSVELGQRVRVDSVTGVL